MSIKIDFFIKRNGIQSKTDTSGLKISSDGELITKLAKMCRWSHASRRGRRHECGFAWNLFPFISYPCVFFTKLKMSLCIFKYCTKHSLISLIKLLRLL